MNSFTREIANPQFYVDD